MIVTSTAVVCNGDESWVGSWFNQVVIDGRVNVNVNVNFNVS